MARVNRLLAVSAAGSMWILGMAHADETMGYEITSDLACDGTSAPGARTTSTQLKFGLARAY